jgi:hypothetical protein
MQNNLMVNISFLYLEFKFYYSDLLIELCKLKREIIPYVDIYDLQLLVKDVFSTENSHTLNLNIQLPPLISVNNFFCLVLFLFFFLVSLKKKGIINVEKGQSFLKIFCII